MSESDELRPRPLNLGDEPPRYPIETFTRGRRTGQDVPELSGRVPPQAIDIEQAVLGAMMLEVDAIAPAIELIGPDSFYKPEHRKVYEAIRGLFEKGHPVDIITDILEEVGLGPVIHWDSFALAKSLTPGYAFGVCFENLTAAQAIREIVRRCLYDLWIDFGEIKIRAYLGEA